MSARPVRLVALGGAVVACWLLAITPLTAVLRAPAALALCFVLPGWALLQLPAGATAPGALERAALAIGASCAVGVVLATAIAISPVGLTGLAFATVLAALSLAALLVAAGRGARQRSMRQRIAALSLAGSGLAAELTAAPESLRRAWPKRIEADHVAWLAMAVLVAGSVLVAAAGARAADPGVLQLWMTRQGSGATVGVYNAGSSDERFELFVGPQGATSPASMEVDVRPGERWQRTIVFPRAWSAAPAILASLYRTGDVEALRTVALSPSGAP